MALAQRFRISAEAYLISPEGPGIFKHASQGPLLLIIDGDERPVRVTPYETGIELWSAHYLPGRDAFFVSRGIPSAGSPRRPVSGCLIVSLDGGARECGIPPGRGYDSGPQGVSSDGLQIRTRRFKDGRLSFDAVNINTGRVSTVEDFILTLPLRMSSEATGASAPCDMGWSRLSPREDMVAAACPVKHASDWRRGIWLFRDGAPPRLLFDFDVPPGSEAAHGLRIWGPGDGDDPPEEMVTRPHEGYGLAWSPDGRLIYWCNGRGKGLLVSVEGQALSTDSPCLTLATWSPDGRKIAGVDRRFELSVWQVPLP